MIEPSSPNKVLKNVANKPPTTPPSPANAVVINSSPTGTRHNGTKVVANK